ncbi:MAG TPA: DPP IV N-terminal domain-containing protein [Gemmatimonadales bacterium]|nr:DPP IV N-terminal domain-containing protein [Gemmatimonadales bacterium]
MRHAVVLAGLGLLAGCGREKPANPALPPVTMVSPDGANHVTARFSPDRKRLYWWQPTGGGFQLWTAGADLSNPVTVPVSSLSSVRVGWSPDGSQVAVPSSNDGLLQVAIIPAAGGAPKQVTHAAGAALGAGWYPDGDRLAYLATAGGSGGGTFRTFVTSISHGGSAPLIPDERRPYIGELSPDGSRIAYMVFDLGHFVLWVADSTGRHPRQLTADGFESFAEWENAWSPDGKEVVYESRRTGTSDVWVVPVDSGAPRQLTHDIRNDWTPRWSPDGKWVAFLSERGKQTDVWVVPAAGGQELRVTDDADVEELMQWLSPTELAFLTGRGQSGIWARSLTDSSERRLTPDSIRAANPRLSPDGKQVVFNVDRGGGVNDIAVALVNGGPMRTLVQGGNNGDYHWSPDGAHLVFASDRGGSNDIWMVDAAGGEPRQLTNWPSSEGDPQWNVDGSAIWFLSDRDTRLGDIWKVSAAGGAPARVTHSGAISNLKTTRGRPELFATVFGASGQYEIAQVKPDGSLLPTWQRTNAFPVDLLAGGDSLAVAEGGKGGHWQFRIIPVTGRGEGQIVTIPGTNITGASADWSLVTYQIANGAVHNLGLLNRKDGTTRRLTTSSFDEELASFTPNGQTMVFQRSRSVRRIAIADLNKLLAGGGK